ncbi:MAG TPA: hypothetical protein VJ723_06080 [Candidatus Angelobacter sp.]|nr:hypothetical protein [Candidatus Angelobacter sp.]
MDYIRAVKVFSASASHVRDLFWNIEEWKRIWAPIRRVVVHYDDQQLQEFEMELSWQDSVICIRTVRIKERNGDIVFFSPSPPGDLSYHAGCWRFADVSKKTCEVVAERWFMLRRLKQETIQNYLHRKQGYQETFQTRVQKILQEMDLFCENAHGK